MTVGPISNAANLYLNNGIQGTEAVVPTIIRSAQEKPKQSDSTVQNTSKTSSGGQQRGGNPALYKRSEASKTKTRDVPKPNPGINIQDELTLSPQAQALLRYAPIIVRYGDQEKSTEGQDHLDLQG